MTVYMNSSMVKAEHIIEINKQLQQLGSKVQTRYLDGQDHALGNVLSTACGEGKYGITLDKINSIKHPEFEIDVKNFDLFTHPRAI